MLLQKHSNRISIGSLSALIGLAVACQVVNADVNVNYSGSTQYSYTFSHVPDLDQKRALLPGTGFAHCVPTAVMNWAAYFANHGAAFQLPGPGNWEDPVNYNAMTLHITNLGNLMGTHPQNGTNGNGAMSGIGQWFIPPYFYAVSHKSIQTGFRSVL